MNRTADVTPEGEYESSFSDPGRILGAALENLSTGRVGIMQESSNNLINAVTIAVRYAAVRKQFCPNNGNYEELPLIEYELHVRGVFGKRNDFFICLFVIFLAMEAVWLRRSRCCVTNLCQQLHRSLPNSGGAVNTIRKTRRFGKYNKKRFKQNTQITNFRIAK